MNKRFFAIALGGLVLWLSVLACGGTISTAHIADAWMATDANGQSRTSTYPQDAVFYAFVDLQNAPSDTTLKAVWTAVDVQDTEKNLVIDEVEYTSGDAVVHFTLENGDYLWPVGQYKVDIYLNDSLAQTLTFEVR